MHIFKSYFKLLARKPGAILLYLLLFTVIFYVNLHGAKRKDPLERIHAGPKARVIAVIDRVQDPGSKAMKAYFGGLHKLFPIEDREEEIQARLRSEQIVAAIIIDKPLAEAFQKKEVPVLLKGNPMRMAYMQVEGQLGHYLRMARMNLSGDQIDQAALESQLKENLPVKLLTRESREASDVERLHGYLRTLPFYLAATILFSLSQVSLAVLSPGAEYRRRVSSYPAGRFYGFLALASLTASVAIYWIYVLLTWPFQGLVQDASLLWRTYLTGTVFSLVMCAMSYFLVSLTENGTAVIAAANVLSLGMAAISGGMVPLSFLPKGVLQVARFFPMIYAMEIFTGSEAGLKPYLGKYMILLLFALGYLLLGLLVHRLRQQSQTILREEDLPGYQH